MKGHTDDNDDDDEEEWPPGIDRAKMARLKKRILAAQEGRDKDVVLQGLCGQPLASLAAEMLAC